MLGQLMKNLTTNLALLALSVKLTQHTGLTVTFINSIKFYVYFVGFTGAFQFIYNSKDCLEPYTFIFTIE